MPDNPAYKQTVYRQVLKASRNKRDTLGFGGK